MGSSWQVKQLHNRQVCRQLQLQKKGGRLPAILVIWFQFLVSPIIENFKYNCIFPPFFSARNYFCQDAEKEKLEDDLHHHFLPLPSVPDRSQHSCQ